MATNPTVVVGSLNDEEIKKTIDSLVEHVNKGMEKIVSNTNSAVDGMKNKLRELGTFKADSSGTADGGSTRRTKSMQMEQKSVQDLEISYDKLLGALQYAQRQTTMYASKNPWSLSTEDLEKYEDAMRRVAEYEKQLASMQGNLALQRIQKSQFTPDMKEYTESLIRPSDELKKMSAYYRELEKSAERHAQAQRQVVNNVQKVDGEIQKQIEDEKRHLELVKELASQARGGMKYSGFSEYTLSGYRTDATVYAENDARAKGLTIEQQIENILKEEEKSFQEQATATSQILQNQKGVTQEQQKRKDIKLDTWQGWQGVDVPRSKIEDVISSKTKQDAISWDEQTSSIKKLQSALKQYQDTYIRLTAEERNSPVGKQMIEDMRVLERVIQNTRKEMSRPTDFNAAMAGTPKTLDEIAQKMQQLTAYRSSLNFTDPRQKEEFDQITQKLRELGKERDKLIGGNDKWIKSNNAVARSLNYIKNRLAFYLTVGASMSFVKQIIETRAQYEMLERSLGILIDSAQRGTETFREMQQMALVSPFTTIELADAAKQLVAYDIAAKDVVDTTRRLGDIAAAVGIPIERMTYALGQIKSYGYMTSINTRMFTRAGIPVVQGLADYYTQLEGRLVSMGDVLDRIKKRAVSYNDVMAVMQSMTDEGGKFFDYQAKMAETLKIQLANLNLAWQNMLNDMGGKYQSFISASIKATKELLLHWRDLDTVLNSVGWTYAVTLGASIIRQKGILIGQQIIVEKLAKAWKDLRIAIVKATQWVMANPWTAAITVALAATIGTIVEYNQALEENRKLTKSLSDDAKEAADSLNKYLKARENMVNRTKAQGGKLNPLESEKAWESIRAEIEKSANSAPELITDLMRITDLNERVSAAFDMAERIEDANNKLSELTSKLKISHDVWGGFFGEGLAEDLEDLTETYEKAGEKWVKTVEVYNETRQGQLGGTRLESRLTVKEDLEEAKAEVENFAKDAADLIRTELEDGVSDPVQVREAVRRIIKEVEKNNPQIRDAGKDFFESYFSVLMGNEFKDVFDPLEIQWNRFLEILKSNSSGLFRNLSDEILEDGKDLTDSQTEAIDKAFKELQSTLPPEFASLVKDMQRQADENPLIIRYKLLEAFDVEVRNAWQKAFDTYFLKPAPMADKNAMSEEENKLRSRFFDLRMKQDETRLQYEKRLQDAEKDNKEQLEQTTYSLTQRLSQISQEEAATDALVLSLKEEQKEQQQLAQDINNVQKVMMLRDKEDKKSKSGSKKDVLGDALSKEIQLINNVQSRFKDYQKMGVGANEAIARATEDYGAALDVINRNLAKFGMRTLSANELANMDLRNVRDLMRDQLDITTRLGNEKGVQALSDAITNINKDITSIDYKRITDGLNNELSKLKDEYELAVELDANPELGNMFADMMGISEEDIAQLPRDAATVAKKAQEIIQQELRKGNLTSLADTFDISKLENIGKLNEWLESAQIKEDSDLYKGVRGWVDFVNKIRLDETKKQIEQWDKLLEKYAEYETKRKRIMEEAERERNIAAQKGASQEIIDAINIREKRELAQLDFEEFQKSPEWITATGDLAGLTNKALGMLIKDLEEYKKKAKNLDPKQMKQLNKALRDLRKQQREGNPFMALANTMEEARARGDVFQDEIDEIDAKLQVFDKKREDGIELTVEEETELQKLTKRWQELIGKKKEATKVSFSDVNKAIGEYIRMANSAADSLRKVADAIGDEGFSESVDLASDIIGNLQAAQQGAEAWGGWWGAIIGGVTDAIPKIIKWASGDKEITEQIKNLERSVKGLELAYKDLQNAIEDAYGYEEVAIKRATIANKQLQLAELERQLALEKSRKKKNQDKDRIMDLEGQIADLRNEIKNSTKEIVNDLLGISSVGDAAEQAVASMIEAYKNGEDYMKVFEDSFEDMIDNMIVKAVAGRVIGDKIQAMFDAVKKVTTDRADNTLYGDSGMTYAVAIQRYASLVAQWKKVGNMEKADNAQKVLNQILKEYEDIARTTPTDLARAKANVQNWRDEVNRDFLSYMDMYGIKPETTDKQLSALQQGIQGITEDTAGALEAYMNGVSQQVYLHSQLLTDIRDAVQAINGDIMLDTQAQMLLQLQQSYAVQVAIQTMLAGWSSADGRSMRVEMM